MSDITIETVVQKYIETREEIKRLEADLEERLAPLKEFQRNREEWLRHELVMGGMKNAATKYGTAYIATKESVTMGDWDAFLGWVQEGERYEYLTHAVNKSAVLDDMGAERGNPPPPGVNYTAVQIVQVRKGKG